jgi:hypothetical protein
VTYATDDRGRGIVRPEAPKAMIAAVNAGSASKRQAKTKPEPGQKTPSLCSIR